MDWGFTHGMAAFYGLDSFAIGFGFGLAINFVSVGFRAILKGLFLGADAGVDLTEI